MTSMLTISPWGLEVMFGELHLTWTGRVPSVLQETLAVSTNFWLIHL